MLSGDMYYFLYFNLTELIISHYRNLLFQNVFLNTVLNGCLVLPLLNSASH